MSFIKSKKGQSMTEFVLVFPAFLLAVLGMAQLAIIFCNSIMLKYTAFMVNRVAVVYAEESEREDKAGLAQVYLKTAMTASNRYEKPGWEMISNMAEQSLIETAAGKLLSRELKLENEEMHTSTGRFLKVTVYYNLPLKVPVVNRLFGFFQKDFSHFAASIAGYPIYTLKAVSIMRVEQIKDEKNI